MRSGISEPALNRKQKVQERDATMMKSEQMPGAKNKTKKLRSKSFKSQ
ncbi:MAG TPA: hypothetical protein VHZ50_05715 [Puia sp.]|nr:hypothetical protein [Puia sp.]